MELLVLLRAWVGLLGAGLLNPKNPLKLLERCVPFVEELAPLVLGECVNVPLTLFVELMVPPVLLCRTGAVATPGPFLVLESGPLSSSCVPGRPPNRGNSKEKLFAPELLLLLSIELNPEARGWVRLSPELLRDNRLRYSRSSICSPDTCARSNPFSWLEASEAFSSSCTLVSRSLRCFSLRSLKARCAARF